MAAAKENLLLLTLASLGGTTARKIAEQWRSLQAKGNSEAELLGRPSSLAEPIECIVSFLLRGIPKRIE